MHKLRTIHLFAGVGGGILADLLLGHQPICAVEINVYCQQTLVQRQKDGIIPWFPIFGDVTEFDGNPWRGIADIIAGGFPCQDISIAGKGGGIDGSRSGLWKEFARVVREVGPQYVFVENSTMLTIRGLGRVLGDLAALGYDARWGVLSAADAIWNLGDPCADHLRERIWICGENSNANRMRKLQPEGGEQDEWGRFCNSLPEVSYAPSIRTRKNGKTDWVRDGSWWCSEPSVCRVADGVPNRMDRLTAIGNGQVPIVAELAWRTLLEHR